MEVEYFSVPTTWKDPVMIADIERMIRQAGYGKHANHRLVISLTEAEAAAENTANQQLQKGDIFLVCDSGGGTTDTNLPKVTSASRGRMPLEPLRYNEGEAIRSTFIDYRAERLILEQLKLICSELCVDHLGLLAQWIVQGRLESAGRGQNHLHRGNDPRPLRHGA
jgi:hypothetical protein